LIDKNDGIDFSAEELRTWKKEHEAMIRSLIKTNASPLAIARKNSDEANAAQRVLDLLDGKGAFYVHHAFEQPEYVIQSLQEARTELSKIIDSLEAGSSLHGTLTQLRAACREYMNNTAQYTHSHEIRIYLDVMRKKVGIIAGSLVHQYGVKIGGDLARIVPHD
jgi:hypothetical protein